MKPLPRPVSTILETPDVQPSVARTWARLQRSRAGGFRWRPVVFATGALVAAALVFVVNRRTPSTQPTVQVVSATPAPEPVPTLERPASLESVMVRGRSKRVTRPPETLVENAVRGDDAVGSMLESAVEAYVAGDARRSATLLAEAVEHHPDDARVGEALVTLGWLQLEQLNEPAEARKSLEHALTLPLSQQLFDRAYPLLERARAARE